VAGVQHQGAVAGQGSQRSAGEVRGRVGGVPLCALALHAGHRHPRRLAGVLVLSAYLLLEHATEAEGHPANADTPMHFFHGDRDEVVALSRGRRAYERFARDGRDVRWAQHPMAHEVCMPQVRAISAWLQDRIG
jgi:phospholipase/carboxylesterase